MWKYYISKICTAFWDKASDFNVNKTFKNGYTIILLNSYLRIVICFKSCKELA